MSVYDDIRARISADEALDAQQIDQDTLEGARADIVGDILEIAEKWRLKAEEWGPEEQYVAWRHMVCQQILMLLDEEFWDDADATPMEGSTP